MTIGCRETVARSVALAPALLLALVVLAAPATLRAGSEDCATAASPIVPNRSLTGERLGVAFGGGGAKAAYEAGLALALAERRVAPAAVAGTSSGALNAVMVALGDTERLAQLWRSIRREDVFGYRAGTVFGGLLPGWLWLSVLRDARSVLDPAPLRQTLERELDLDRLRTAPTRVLVLTADLLTGRSRAFDNATLTVDALIASATVPGLFPPVALDGALLVDGGIVQRAPTLELLDTHPLDRLLVVVGYESQPLARSTVQAVLERALEIALSREILRDVELARLRHPRVPIHVVRPTEPLDTRPLEFDGERLGRLVDLGRRDGLACLGALGYGP